MKRVLFCQRCGRPSVVGVVLYEMACGWCGSTTFHTEHPCARLALLPGEEPWQPALTAADHEFLASLGITWQSPEPLA